MVYDMILSYLSPAYFSDDIFHRCLHPSQFILQQYQNTCHPGLHIVSYLQNFVMILPISDSFIHLIFYVPNYLLIILQVPP